MGEEDGADAGEAGRTQPRLVKPEGGAPAAVDEDGGVAAAHDLGWPEAMRRVQRAAGAEKGQLKVGRHPARLPEGALLTTGRTSACAFSKDIDSAPVWRQRNRHAGR